ncbi:hypothetical protein F1559_003895 [Cyanidiococcus yangmingshanensis]|uniref:Uncharacterized protein n=1 Tax=Cyanidiococcus yangmingshanensis TaxID=2690220 RepID=A0A7J7ILC8_9RHOD|nr:hypothetical protein F1559_003895 [Cyanidiococcus yangmingshanensis]
MIAAPCLGEQSDRALSFLIVHDEYRKLLRMIGFSVSFVNVGEHRVPDMFPVQRYRDLLETIGFSASFVRVREHRLQKMFHILLIRNDAEGGSSLLTDALQGSVLATSQRDYQGLIAFPQYVEAPK